MKANLKRDGDAAHWYYPMLMKGEWPVLLKILGKGEGEERYLSVDEVRTLFVEKRLPERITAAAAEAFGWKITAAHSLRLRRFVTRTGIQFARNHDSDHLNSGVPGTKASNAAQNCPR